MGVFESVQSFPYTLPDLAPVAQDLMRHFEQQGYEVKGEPTMTRGWHISLHKGGVFKAVVGMKTAMNIEIEPAGKVTTAKAGIGIFGLQAIPTAISFLLFWPVLIPQLWGIVQTSKLDEEALREIETSLKVHSAVGVGAMADPTTAVSAGSYCTNCGAKLPDGAKFCSECGGKV
jgi:zinc-ribbon domain